MNVLITGGFGFIGGHLVDSQLAHGNRVRVLDVHPPAPGVLQPSAQLEIISGDVRDTSLIEQCLAGIDVVYHLASAHLDVRLPPSHFWDVNVDGTRGLLTAALAAGVQRVVHCSSVGVMGHVKQPPADESTSLFPTNVYEQSKLGGENVAREIAAATGLYVIIARPAWVYGPRCPRTAKLLRTIRKKRFVIFGSGRTLRHPLYVGDAVRGLESCAAARSAPGEIYILAGDRAVTINELVRTAAEVLQVPAPRVHLPVGLGLLGGLVLQTVFKLVGKSPPFSQRSMDFFLKDNAYETKKAAEGLGFIPQVDLRSGLETTWQWLQSSQQSVHTDLRSRARA